MNLESLKVPNFFYDLIVFMTPSVSLVTGILWGIGANNSKNIIVSTGISNAAGFDFLMAFIVVFLLFLFFAYEYGRLAEALSTWISSLVSFLRRKKICFTKEKDFSICLKSEIQKMQLDQYLDNDRIGSKWTIYFYAMRFQPLIGADIMKRYAWEKLSRSSAFTFGLLFLVSLALAIPRIFGIIFFDTGLFGFGSLTYTFGMLFFTVIAVYEFYRRRCWNNDLLKTIIPIIMLPDDFKVDLSQVLKKT